MTAKPENINLNRITALLAARAELNPDYTDREHMAADLGFLLGWLARIAATDYMVRAELIQRLEDLGVEEGREIIVNRYRIR